MKAFPRTDVAGESLSRMIIGTNWLLGWSHTSPSSDLNIKQTYQKPEDFFPVLQAYLEYGIDTIMGMFAQSPLMTQAVQYAQEKTGKKFIIIDTPIINVSDDSKSRKEAEKTIKRSAECGATFCYPHHSSVEQLVNKNKGIIERLDDYTSIIRDNGMIPGLSAHMPEIIVYSDNNNYDVESYIQIYNCLGFLMQVEVEMVASIIHNAKKPVMTIKSMAAGRCTPYVGLNFSWNTLREKDMITVGCFSPEQVHEDVEISFAAFEKRFPNLAKRSSPNTDQAAFGK